MDLNNTCIVLKALLMTKSSKERSQTKRRSNALISALSKNLGCMKTKMLLSKSMKLRKRKSKLFSTPLLPNYTDKLVNKVLNLISLAKDSLVKVSQVLSKDKGFLPLNRMDLI